MQRTSLQEIADRLGITKPSLYYHFSSREELVRSIVQPILDEEEAFLVGQEALGEVEPRALLEGYFDFHYRHRAEMVLMLSELTTLADLGLIDLVLDWRRRLVKLLQGPEPTLEQAARAVIAFGGLPGLHASSSPTCRRTSSAGWPWTAPAPPWASMAGTVKLGEC